MQIEKKKSKFRLAQAGEKSNVYYSVLEFTLKGGLNEVL